MWIPANQKEIFIEVKKLNKNFTNCSELDQTLSSPPPGEPYVYGFCWMPQPLVIMISLHPSCNH